MSFRMIHVLAVGVAVSMSLSPAATATSPRIDSVGQTAMPTPFVARGAPVAAVARYPLAAAGWGPDLGDGFMASRWAEHWSATPAVGTAPALKAIPVGASGLLTLSAEARLRHVASDHTRLQHGADTSQTQLRAIVGANLRINPQLRVYGEVGTGQVDGQRRAAAASFRNDASLQQLFVDVGHAIGPMQAGVMLGRQEFADGPRQLISLGDGPNLHRTWNGARFYAHGDRSRLGAYELRASRLGHGGFDDGVDDAQTLQGVNASFMVSTGEAANTFFDPFWIHSKNPRYRIAGSLGLDDRDTFGARLWGRQGALRFDWALARQTGRTVDDRAIDAWGVFAVQSLTLSDAGWKPRLTLRLDAASGGGTSGAGTVRNFNPLYASSGYLGEGRFLGLSNLLMVAPGVTFAPMPKTSLSLELGQAWRANEDEVVHAGGARTYADTASVPGRQIGRLLRLAGAWSAGRHWSFRLYVEHLQAGSVLRDAGLGSGTYAYVDATFRY